MSYCWNYFIKVIRGRHCSCTEVQFTYDTLSNADVVVVSIGLGGLGCKYTAVYRCDCFLSWLMIITRVEKKEKILKIPERLAFIMITLSNTHSWTASSLVRCTNNVQLRDWTFKSVWVLCWILAPPSGHYWQHIHVDLTWLLFALLQLPPSTELNCRETQLCPRFFHLHRRQAESGSGWLWPCHMLARVVFL